VSAAEFADEISGVIMEEYEPRLIEKRIFEYYGALDEDEINEIIDSAMKIAREEDSSAPYMSYSERERMVRRRAAEYLKTEESVIPRGLTDFRIKELSETASMIASAAAEKYFRRREYEEFAEVLRMLVTLRRGEKVLHIFWSDGKIILKNRFYRDVTPKYEAEFRATAAETNITEDDVALSAVISAAPEEIVLHEPPDSPLVSVLKTVFEGRFRTE